MDQTLRDPSRRQTLAISMGIERGLRGVCPAIWGGVFSILTLLVQSSCPCFPSSLTPSTSPALSASLYRCISNALPLPLAHSHGLPPLTLPASASLLLSSFPRRFSPQTRRSPPTNLESRDLPVFPAFLACPVSPCVCMQVSRSYHRPGSSFLFFSSSLNHPLPCPYFNLYRFFLFHRFLQERVLQYFIVVVVCKQQL